MAESTHIDHYLSSLSEALPAELAVDYATPRKTVADEPATRALGVGYATLQEVQETAVEAKRMVAAAGRKLGLQQHWIDFAGRKTPAKGRKGIVGSVEMADATPTKSSARALMAGYADSAANKQAAELRKEFGTRIEALETGFSTFSTQLQSVDSKMERQHSELLQAVRNKVTTAAAASATKVPFCSAAAAAVAAAATVATSAASSSVKLAGNNAGTAEAGSSCRPVLGQWEESARLLGLWWTTC